MVDEISLETKYEQLWLWYTNANSTNDELIAFNTELMSVIEDERSKRRKLETKYSALESEATMSTNISHLNEIAKKQFEWVEEMGWHNKTPLEYIALIASEVGEAANECRGAAPSPKLGLELADIILRTLDFAQVQGIDIEDEVLSKMQANKERGTQGRVK